MQVLEQVNETGRLPAGSGTPDVGGNWKALAIDVNAEEKQLQAAITKLMSVARQSSAPLASVPLSSSVFRISAAVWQALVSDYPEDEKSFRVALHQAVRRAVGILAAIQEEIALYKIRLTGDFLWKRHWNSLCYLDYCAAQVLPLLEQQGNEARHRGLMRKAEDVRQLASQLQHYRQQISESNPEKLVILSGGLKVDPKWLETNLQGMIHQLTLLARASEAPVASIPLPNSVLPLSATEWQALVTDYPETEKSFRADSNRVLRRAVGMLAALQEETALRQADIESKSWRKNHLSTLFYLGHSAAPLLPELEELGNEAQRRGLHAMAGHVQEMVARMQHHADHISKLHQQWKQQRPADRTVS